MSVLAGSSDRTAHRFFPLLLVGLTLWAVLTRTVASRASGPLARASSLLLDHPGLAAGLLLAVAVAALWPLARSRDG